MSPHGFAVSPRSPIVTVEPAVELVCGVKYFKCEASINRPQRALCPLQTRNMITVNILAEVLTLD